jgi:quercetin dioxygenase-like cupin family protein
MIVLNPTELAKFSAEKMGKTTIAQGASMMVGLNCFEPGQEHAAHTHAGQDKLYVVLEGSAEVVVGEEKQTVEAGAIAFASSGVVHSIRNVGEGRLVVMAVLAPPPVAK